MTILIVEDDNTIAEGLEYSLQQEKYNTILCNDIASAKKEITTDNIDLCLLDLTLPDGSGYEICRFVKAKYNIPVIFLTACDDEVNVVMGLDMGGDDYITKPFRIRELLSRIKNALRRYDTTSTNSGIVEIDNIKININEAKVYKNNIEVVLTALEYRLLLTLVNNRGNILSRNQLLEGIWDISGEFVNDNTLTVYIKRLREKLEINPSEPKIINTVRGLGYRIGG